MHVHSTILITCNIIAFDTSPFRIALKMRLAIAILIIGVGLAIATLIKNNQNYCNMITIFPF